MNKRELIEKMARQTTLTGVQSKEALEMFCKIVEETLKNGEKIQIAGFGTFEAIKKKSRVGRNPRTGEMMDISARCAPKFKPGKTLKDAVGRVNPNNSTGSANNE